MKDDVVMTTPAVAVSWETTPYKARTISTATFPSGEQPQKPRQIPGETRRPLDRHRRWAVQMR